jgi:hypothetical protein
VLGKTNRNDRVGIKLKVQDIDDRKASVGVNEGKSLPREGIQEM